MKKLMRFFKDEDGATAVEYGLMVAAISAIIVTIVFTLGTQVKQGFTTTSGAFTAGGITPAP